MEEGYKKYPIMGDEKLQKVYECILDSVGQIAEMLRFHKDRENAFGDKQLDIDVNSDQIIFNNLKGTELVAFALSEEKPFLNEMGGSEYIVTFDPLDGSSIIGTNFSVGSIFGIWPNTANKLIGSQGKDQISSLVAVYGSRTTLLIYNQVKAQVEELTLSKINPESELLYWNTTESNIVISEKTNLFAPGNLRAVTERPAYKTIVDYWINSGYTLRYTGGLVPDVFQIFIKRHGIVTNFVSKGHGPKLRYLYEAAPLAYLMEKAGGMSYTPDGQCSMLDTFISGYEQRSELALGSANEVLRIKNEFGQEKVIAKELQ